jgi:hypothetical protein
MALGPTQPPIQWVTGGLFLGVKRPGCEADHSPSSSSEVKNAWRYTSTPQFIFMAWCLLKHRDNFALRLPYCEYLFSCFRHESLFYLSTLFLNSHICKYFQVILKFGYIMTMLLALVARFSMKDNWVAEKTTWIGLHRSEAHHSQVKNA